MKALPLFSLVLLGACTTNGAPVPDARAAPATTEAAALSGAEHIRTTFVVSDAEASLALYRDAMGMRVLADRMIGTAAISAPTTGEPGAQARFVVLAGPDSDRGMIGIMQWTDPPMPEVPPYAARLAPGSIVLVIRVLDAEKACREAEAIERVIITGPLQQNNFGTGERVIRSLGCTLFDPDGNLLELSQRLG